VRTKVAVLGAREGGTQFTCFTSTKVQVLTRLLRTQFTSFTVTKVQIMTQRLVRDYSIRAYANTATKRQRFRIQFVAALPKRFVSKLDRVVFVYAR